MYRMRMNESLFFSSNDFDTTRLPAEALMGLLALILHTVGCILLYCSREVCSVFRVG
jgi:hypothetical protein